MPTLILSPRATDDSQLLWRAAVQMGWEVERLSSWRIPSEFHPDDPVLYVEALMAPLFAAQLGLKLKEPPEDWLCRLPEEYRCRQIRLTTLGEARNIVSPSFIKPPNDKSFKAGVYSHGASLPAEFPDDMHVLVAEPVAWEKEFRCFVLDGVAKTGSIYLRNGVLQNENEFVCETDELQEALSFAATVANKINGTPSAIVIDVGVITGRGWSVVELNAPWGSGIYGCDPRHVLPIIHCSMQVDN
jgi:hypothetical protein